MIVCASFAGDENNVLQWIQHSTYEQMIVRLFVLCRDRYLAASSLLRVEDQLSVLLRPMKSFDHRTLQDAHDRIAASFRFRFTDSFQLLLGEDDSGYKQRLEARWREYFYAEAEHLVTDDEFARSICTATAKGNKEPGYSAETWLRQFVDDRYPLYDVNR